SLLSAGRKASAEEPATAGRLSDPIFLPTYRSPSSLTEPPHVQGLLNDSAVSTGRSCLPTPAMIGGASVGLYRFVGNDSPLPMNRMFGTFGVPAPVSPGSFPSTPVRMIH